MGGGSGYAEIFLSTAIPGETYGVVVGKGGPAVQVSSTNNKKMSGSAGQSSIFKTHVANGGYGGNSFDLISGTSGQGGQSSDFIYVQSSSQVSNNPYSITPYGGMKNRNTDNSNPVFYINNTFPSMCINPFEANAPMLAAGGSGCGMQSWWGQKEPIQIGDKYTSAAVFQYAAEPPLSATMGTLPGCGGGCACLCTQETKATKVATSAAGCDGAVYIYALKSL